MKNGLNGNKAIFIGLVIAVTVVGIGAQVSGSLFADSVLTGCVVVLAMLALYVGFQSNTGHPPKDSRKTSRLSDTDMQECVDGIPAPAFILGSTQNVLACNEHAQEVFGVSQNVMLGSEFDYVDNRKVGHLPKAANHNGGAGKDVLYKDQIILLDGEDKVTGTLLLMPLDYRSAQDDLVLAVVTPQRTEDLPSYEPLSLDVPKKVLLHDDDKILLRELNHDLRTRFQNASGIVDILALRDFSAEGKPYISSLQKIFHEAVDRLDSLVSFLELDEIDHTQNTSGFGVDELLNDISFDLGQRMDIEENEILFDTDHSVAKSVRCNRELMAKIVSHLVLHVLAGGAGKTVLIRVRLAENEVSQPELSIEVMSKGTADRASISEVDLDLEIARRIASQTGGQLFLGHRYLDFSGVVFRTPVSEVDTFRSGLVVPTHLKNLQALIVDDNDVSRTVFEQLTSVLGWNVDVAASGESALHMIKFKQGLRETYDVILIDWRMPGLDGWETSKKVRELQNGGKTPIIVMISAHNRSFLSKNVEDRGRVLNGFLTKPVTLTMLLDAVADATAHIQGPTVDVDVFSEGAETLAGNTVLIVDDNQMHREVAKEFMVRNGAKILTASGGYEAISKVQNHCDQIDVVLMDVQMPDLNGFDAVRRIRELGYGDIPILMMTANSTSELHHHCIQAGANDILIKPFVMREILSALSEHVGRAKQVKRARLERHVSAEVSQAAEKLGFNIEVVEQNFSGRLSGYIKSLERFVIEANRLLKRFEEQPDQDTWKDIAREAQAIGGMLSLVGAAVDAHRFKQCEGELQTILGERADGSDGENELKEISLRLTELISSRLSASEQLLLHLGKGGSEKQH